MTVLTSRWYSEPVSRHVRIRRSTALLIALFVGFGALFLATRPDPDPDPPPAATQAGTAAMSTYTTSKW